ncbi:MAG: MGMT family protein [Cellulomonadaceae bacterium]|jgi:alkylated DNA nucleotide flippase Atl1|nr:MGMT family protein [Cellulomonadaceae bacterium]
MTPAHEYAAAVLDVVRQIPPGHAMTYGLIAEVVAEKLGRGGPRQVGNVMSGGETGDPATWDDVPWWRVVNASGNPPAHYITEALDALRAEATPLKRNGTQVDLKRAIWYPGK